MKVMISLAVLLLAGCIKPMSNEDIIRETTKCEAAGLEARPKVFYWDMTITDIQCAPRDACPAEGR
jgi:hypothetical protein